MGGVERVTLQILRTLFIAVSDTMGNPLSKSQTKDSPDNHTHRGNKSENRIPVVEEPFIQENAYTCGKTETYPNPSSEQSIQKTPLSYPSHPSYATMIAAAIAKLGDKKGSSRQAILKIVIADNKVDASKAGNHVNLALRKMIADKKVVAAAATGKKGSGCYKLVPKKTKVKPIKNSKTKKPVIKKPANKLTSKRSEPKKILKVKDGNKGDQRIPVVEEPFIQENAYTCGITQKVPVSSKISRMKLNKKAKTKKPGVKKLTKK